MGKANLALEANRSAQLLCKDDQEGIKDLEQQHLKFLAEVMADNITGIIPPSDTTSVIVWCLQHASDLFFQLCPQRKLKGVYATHAHTHAHTHSTNIRNSS